MRPRIACLGHQVYFENHFCERQSRFFDVAWFNYDHYASMVYDELIRYRPDVTLIYRPELHDAQYLGRISGFKIGFSTEPLPKISRDGAVLNSSETDRRLAMIKRLQSVGFDRIYHYDQASRSFIERHRLPIDDYAVIPVNTNYFNPRRKQVAKWDVVFLGKATERRSRILGRLKNFNVRFLWVEHGVSSFELVHVFKRAKCILNVHADDIEALAPRVYLAAACGIPVLSDPTGENKFPFSRLVRTADMENLSVELINDCISDIDRSGVMSDSDYLEACVDEISVERFLLNAIEKLI